MLGAGSQVASAQAVDEQYDDTRRWRQVER
jgi:hypothetical protein